MTGVPTWQVSPHHRCPYMTGVPTWQVSLMAGAPTWQVAGNVKLQSNLLLAPPVYKLQLCIVPGDVMYENEPVYKLHLWLVPVVAVIGSFDCIYIIVAWKIKSTYPDRCPVSIYYRFYCAFDFMYVQVLCCLWPTQFSQELVCRKVVVKHSINPLNKSKCIICDLCPVVRSWGAVVLIL